MYGVVIFTYGVFACNQYRGWYCIIDCWFGIAKVQKAIIQSIFYRRWIVCRNLRTYLWCFLFDRCVRHRACSKLTTKFQFGGQPKIHRRAQLYALCQCIAFVGAHTQTSIRHVHRMLVFSRSGIKCSLTILPPGGGPFHMLFYSSDSSECQKSFTLNSSFLIPDS